MAPNTSHFAGVTLDLLYLTTAARQRQEIDLVLSARLWREGAFELTRTSTEGHTLQCVT